MTSSQSLYYNEYVFITILLITQKIMPYQNGTGPRGMGPRTGRGLGPCGLGLRRGYGRRWRRNVRRWPVQWTKEDELKAMEEEKELLSEELEELRKEIEEMKKDKKS